MAFDLGFDETRVLGCLIEKAATTPDNYPLTLNALRNACNQSTSREPVVSFDDQQIEAALATLRERGITRTVHSTSNRARKYRHVADEYFHLDDAELALVSVLLLRGHQTTGELKQRADRQHGFMTLDDVHATLEGLASRDEPLVVRLDRQPGQKDARWAQLLMGAVNEPPPVSRAPSAQVSQPTRASQQPGLRVVRPASSIDLLAEQYASGLGWSVVEQWVDRAGYDSAVLQSNDALVEIEFVHVHLDPEPSPPHHEQLLVVYVEDLAAANDAMLAAGFDPVGNPNPSWGQQSHTFSDIEAGRIVIANR